VTPSEISSDSMKALPRIFSASGLFRCPSRIDTSAAAPMPTSMPKAMAMIMMGKVTLRPASASDPTPRPM